MRLASRLAAALALAAGLSACKTHYDVEGREAVVEVVLEAPDAAKAPVTRQVLVYVGERKAIDRTVTFPQGRPRVEVPPVYVRSGDHEVSVVVGGRAVARAKASVAHYTWVVVTLEGEGAAIDVRDKAP